MLSIDTCSKERVATFFLARAPGAGPRAITLAWHHRHVRYGTTDTCSTGPPTRAVRDHRHVRYYDRSRTPRCESRRAAVAPAASRVTSHPAISTRVTYSLHDTWAQ